MLKQPLQSHRSGMVLYPPLPVRVESNKTTLRFSVHRRWQDIRILLTVGVLGGIVALLTPILTGEILVGFYPTCGHPAMDCCSGRPPPWPLSALQSSRLCVDWRCCALRAGLTSACRLLSGVGWSPCRRRFSAISPPVTSPTGPTASAKFGRMLTGAAVQTAMGGIFSIFSLALLFYYSWSIALCVCGLLLLLVGATWFFSLGQLRHFREVFRVHGVINGFVFQMLSGLAKIRVAHAESYALAHWAQRYAKQKQENLAALRWAAGPTRRRRHVSTPGPAGYFRPCSLYVHEGTATAFRSILPTLYPLVLRSGSSQAQ